MNVTKLDQLLQYALVVAAQARHGVTLTQLVKYAYLGDLEFARCHEGQTYTETEWKFLHFGPWAASVQDRVPDSMDAIGARADEFEVEDGGHGVSYSLDGQFDDSLLTRFERDLPVEIARTIKYAVHKYVHNANSLLHFVYATEPMLNAAPGEVLKFCTARPPETPSSQEALTASPPMGRKALRERRAKFAEVREEARHRMHEYLERRHALQKQAAVTPPRYDDVYEHGVQWLQSLAGAEPEAQEAVAEFSDDVWKSSARRGEPIS